MSDSETKSERGDKPLRILFATLALPFPPTNGQRMRNWGILRALAQEGHRVTLLTFADAAEFGCNFSPLNEICEDVKLVPLPGAKSAGWRMYGSRLGGLFSPLPYGAIKYRSTAMETAVREAIERRFYNAVICDNIYQFSNLPESVYDRVLLNKHDFTFIILRRLLAGTRDPLKLAYGWIEYWKLRRWELGVCSKVARVLVCSELDGEVLRAAIPSVPIAVVPNVIDIEGYRPRHNDDGKTLLFFGAMDYHANEDAAQFFISRILPEVRKTNPGVRFVVAGRNPSNSLLRRYAGVPGVEFTGTVGDMRSVIPQATVCVVPLRIGSGTRLKILEAAAMEMPIVSTRLGAEGLDFRENEEIVLADGPQEFAEALLSLMKHPERRRALGCAARNRAEKFYSIPALRLAIHDALGDKQTEALLVGHSWPGETGNQGAVA